VPERSDYFNPLDKKNLAQSLAYAFVRQPERALPPEPFKGAGVYALYYGGDFNAYQPLVHRNTIRPENKVPIYVGRAIPEGGRKGGVGFNALEGTALYNRLKEHARSIEQAQNLKLGDFTCRYLVVDDIWIPLAENILISLYQPLWNVVVDGFGIHDPGKGRRRQAKSEWDILHPGRKFAEELPAKKTLEEILARILSFWQELKFS
jgi:hypothetical protein